MSTNIDNIRITPEKSRKKKRKIKENRGKWLKNMRPNREGYGSNWGVNNPGNITEEERTTNTFSDRRIRSKTSYTKPLTRSIWSPQPSLPSLRKLRSNPPFCPLLSVIFQSVISTCKLLETLVIAGFMGIFQEKNREVIGPKKERKEQREPGKTSDQTGNNLRLTSYRSQRFVG